MAEKRWLKNFHILFNVLLVNFEAGLLLCYGYYITAALN